MSKNMPTVIPMMAIDVVKILFYKIKHISWIPISSNHRVLTRHRLNSPLE